MRTDVQAAELPITVIDFEGTGSVSGYPDEPWQIGMVRFSNGKVLTDETFESLLRVGDRPFSRHAPGRHAQLRNDIATAPKLETLWPVLRGWVSGCLCAHNPATEKRYLKNAFPLHPMGPWIDTLKLARIAVPNAPSHTLEDILLQLGLKTRVDALLPEKEPHDALYDAVGSAVLLETILALPGWESITIDALLRAKPNAYNRRRRQNE